MNNFYNDFKQFCGNYSEGIIDAYNRGLATMEETLATLLDNKRNKMCKDHPQYAVYTESGDSIYTTEDIRAAIDYVGLYSDDNNLLWVGDPDGNEVTL